MGKRRLEVREFQACNNELRPHPQQDFEKDIFNSFKLIFITANYVMSNSAHITQICFLNSPTALYSICSTEICVIQNYPRNMLIFMGLAKMEHLGQRGLVGPKGPSTYKVSPNTLWQYLNLLQSSSNIKLYRWLTP